MKWPKTKHPDLDKPEPKTVLVEGVIAHERMDPDGHQFQLDGLDCAEFLAEAAQLMKQAKALREKLLDRRR